MWGEEPLQHTEAIDRIRRYAHEQGYADRVVLHVDAGFDWGRLQLEASTLSLLSRRRLIELRLPPEQRSPGRNGARVLSAYAAAPPPDTLLLISIPARLDRKSAWFKALNAAGISVAARTISDLPRWLVQRATVRGLRLDPAAAAFIAERTEGNLLAAHQELERLALLGTTDVGLKQLMREIADSTRYNVFDMLEHALSGSLKCLRMLHGLQQEGTDPMAIHGAAAWEIRRLCRLCREDRPDFNRHGIWGSRRSAVQRALQRGPRFAEHLLYTAIQVEHALKTDRDEGRRALDRLLLQMCGKTGGPGPTQPTRP